MGPSLGSRILALYAVLLTLVVGALVFETVQQRRRIVALERLQQPAPVAASVASTSVRPPAPARRRASAAPYRASNGVVLSAEEVARLEERAREMDRHVAELEWRLIGRDQQRSKPASAPTSQGTGSDPSKP